jgi:hypothetical protein
MLRPRLDGNIQFQMMCEMYGEPERGGVHDFGSHRLIICRARTVRPKIRHHLPFAPPPSGRDTQCTNTTGVYIEKLFVRRGCFNRCNPNPNPRVETMVSEYPSDTH